MLRIVEGNEHALDKAQFLDSLNALDANYKKFYHKAICHCLQVQLSKMQHKELSLNAIAFMLNQILELKQSAKDENGRRTYYFMKRFRLAID